jgi:hypothetical protein
MAVFPLNPGPLRYRRRFSITPKWQQASKGIRENRIHKQTMRLPDFDCHVFNAVFCAVHCLLRPQGPNSLNGFSTEQRSTDSAAKSIPCAGQRTLSKSLGRMGENIPRFVKGHLTIRTGLNSQR